MVKKGWEKVVNRTDCTEILLRTKITIIKMNAEIFLGEEIEVSKF